MLDDWIRKEADKIMRDSGVNPAVDGSNGFFKLCFWPEEVEMLCGCIAKSCESEGINPDVVVATSPEELALAMFTAKELSPLFHKQARPIFFCGPGSKIAHEYKKIMRGKQCLIVSGIVVRCPEILQVKDFISTAEGKVTDVAMICNCNPSEITAESLGVTQLIALTSV